MIAPDSGILTLACADLDARPLFWTDDNGLRHGYEPEVALAVADRLGLELKWKFLQWSDFVPALLEGRVDAIWCGCAITPERQQQFLFSRPYAVFNESLLVSTGSKVRSEADVAGLRIGAISGSTNMTLAQTWDGCEPVGFDGQSDDVFADMINALANGEIDGVVDDQPAFGGVLADQRFRLAFTVETRNAWGAALRPDHEDLKQELDQALDELIDIGEIRTIWERNLASITYPGLQ